MELELDQDWYGMETQVSVTGTQETNKVDSLKCDLRFFTFTCHIFLSTCFVFQFRFCPSSAELDSLLRVPILPRSVSMAYPTRDENHKLLSGIKGARKVYFNFHLKL